MQIKQKLEYPIWKIPSFCITGIYVFVKLVRAGTLTLLINKQLFNKKTNLILKFFNFIFYKESKSEIGKKLLSCLIDLGPGYIKFGQALSTRPDLIDKKTCEYLKKLQDDIRPFSGSIAKKIVESESKNSIDNIFSSFNEKPIANASVAQVHTALLKTGEKVAVKLLKPNITKQLFNDFIFFYWISKCLELTIPSIKRLKLSKNVEVLSEVSINELDLTLEASAAEELSENFKDNPNYKVPKIYWELTSKKMLVLEYIKGVRIDDINALKKAHHNVKKITPSFQPLN